MQYKPLKRKRRRDTYSGTDDKESEQQRTDDPVNDIAKEAPEGKNACKATKTRSKQYVDT